MSKKVGLLLKEICPVCKSSDIKVVNTLHRDNLLGCNNCHHLFSKLLVEDVNYNETVMGRDINHLRLKQLVQILKNFDITNKRVIDLGCGTGVLLGQLNHKFNFKSMQH